MSFFKTFFLLFIIVPTIISFWKHPSFTLFIIILCQSFFYIPFIQQGQLQKRKLNYLKTINVKNISVYAVVIVYVLIDFSEISNIFNDLFSGKYIESGLEKALNRYKGHEASLNTILRITLFFSYSWLMPFSRIKTHKKVIIYFLMLVIESAHLARASVLLSAINVFIAYVFIKRDFFASLKIRDNFKYIFYSIIILLPIYFFSAYGRVAHNDNALEIAFNKIGAYSIASYDALAIWASNFKHNEMNFGSNTFGIIKKIYGQEKVIGAFEFVDTEYGPTNIYTLSRTLYQDFWFFSAFIWFFMGYSIIKLFGSKLNSYNTYLYLSFLPLLIFIFFSPFYFNSYFLGYIFFVLLSKLK